MPKKPIVNPAAINAILSTAPVIVQGAAKLIKMIREGERQEPPTADVPATIEGLKQEIQRLDRRVDANSESDVEQIKLIEELARQNEAVAASLERTAHRINVCIVLAVVALVFGGIALVVAAA